MAAIHNSDPRARAGVRVRPKGSGCAQVARQQGVVARSRHPRTLADAQAHSASGRQWACALHMRRVGAGAPEIAVCGRAAHALRDDYRRRSLRR